MTYVLDVNQLVEDNLPAGFSVSTNFIENRLKTWQILLYRAAGIADEDKFKMDDWNDDWRLVLAYCIIYNVYMTAIAGKYILGSSNSGDGGASIKKITTGPAEVEYHNDAATLAMLIKNWGKPGGLLYMFFAEACMAASNVGVKLPFCAPAKTGAMLSILKPGKEKIEPCLPCSGDTVVSQGSNKPCSGC